VPRETREACCIRLRAVFDRAGAGLGLVSRGPYPSRSVERRNNYRDLPVECGTRCRDRAAAAGRAAEEPAARVAARRRKASSEAKSATGRRRQICIRRRRRGNAANEKRRQDRRF
jgi:hypothetical protein